MKIGIYHEFSDGDEPGGAERCVAILAEALQHSHDVEIVNHCPAAGVTALARFAGVNLERVSLRHVPPSRDPERLPLMPWRRFRSARQWHESLSSGYDLF